MPVYDGAKDIEEQNLDFVHCEWEKQLLIQKRPVVVIVRSLADR